MPHLETNKTVKRGTKKFPRGRLVGFERREAGKGLAIVVGSRQIGKSKRRNIAVTKSSEKRAILVAPSDLFPVQIHPSVLQSQFGVSEKKSKRKTLRNPRLTSKQITTANIKKVVTVSQRRLDAG